MHALVIASSVRCPGVVDPDIWICSCSNNDTLLPTAYRLEPLQYVLGEILEGGRPDTCEATAQ